MSIKKRFYIDQERVNKEMHHSFVYLRDRTQSPPEEPLWIDTADRTDTDELRYLKELCDLLNKGWEATEELPVDVAELRDQQRAYGFRLASLLIKLAEEKYDSVDVEKVYYIQAINDLFDAVSSGKCLTRASLEATTCCCGFCVRESQERTEEER